MTDTAIAAPVLFAGGDDNPWRCHDILVTASGAQCLSVPLITAMPSAVRPWRLRHWPSPPAAGAAAQPGFARTGVGRQLGLEHGAQKALGEVQRARTAASRAVHTSVHAAGIRAFMRTFKSYDLNLDVLAAFDRPVYFALGGLSNPDQFGELPERLGEAFPDFTLEVVAERHHFDPPRRIEPERLAASLRAIWARGSQPVYEG